MVLGALSAACHGDRKTTHGESLVGRPDVNATQQRGNLWYRVALEDGRLDAAVRLFSPPPQTRFFLPTEWAGRDDFADVIGITGATTPNGPAAVAINRAAGEVEVEVDGADWVQLEYRVELSAVSAFHAQLDGGVLVAFGPTFLVTPAQQVLERTTQIPIELRLPADFEVVSTWPSVGASMSEQAPEARLHRFVAADVSELRDAFIVAGPMLRIVRTGTGPTLVEVAFAPAFEGDTAEFAELVASVTERFRKRFGDSGPVHAYVRTRSSAAGDFGGFGRRGGFILDVPPDTSVSDATRLLVAHEALHVWNGHRLIPTAQVEARTRWFKEGVTHYLALKSLGELDEAFVLAELTQVAANYARNPIVRGAPGKPLDGTRLPYDFGVLVALGLDAALTSASSGATDLTCWLSTLLERENQRYDELQLFEALQQCAGPGGGRRVAQLWRQWVRAREPIALRELFSEVGLHWLPETPQSSARLVPLEKSALPYRRLFALENP